MEPMSGPVDTDRALALADRLDEYHGNAGPPTYMASAAALRALVAERDSLQRWKDEAITVLAQWDDGWEKLGRPGPLGASKARSVGDEIERRSLNYLPMSVVRLRDALYGDEVDRLVAERQAVLDLHVNDPVTPGHCIECYRQYPCPTVRALGVTEDESKKGQP
jgi:hypothetical protein